MILDEGVGRRLGKPHEKVAWGSDVCFRTDGSELVPARGLACSPFRGIIGGTNA